MIWRALLTLAALLGLWAGGVFSLAHLKRGEVCPVLGPVPACFVAAPFVFAPGFAPVFGLAATGVALELAHGDISPKPPAAFPSAFSRWRWRR